MASENPIRILFVDDHPIVRSGLTALVSSQPDMVIVGEAGTALEAITLFSEYQPDVTLMDLQLPGMQGLDAIRTIREKYSEARIIVLSTYGGDQDVRSALESGAKGYLMKASMNDDLLGVIRAVHDGQTAISDEIAGRLEANPTPVLTKREMEVLVRMAKGKSNLEIASSLGIAQDTVKVYVKAILLKFHVGDRMEAVVTALRRGFIRIE